MLRVAIIGLGKMGLLHASLLNTLPDVQLVAICEKSALIRRFSKKAFGGIKLVARVRELADLGLDGIFVTTPPSSHFSIVNEVYSRRIARHVFVEKPLAFNWAESAKICTLTKDGAVNMVGYQRRFSVTFRKAKDILDEGVLGELTHFEAHAYSSDFLGVRTASNPLRRVGVLRDLGCHAIDLALWFFGQLEVETAEVDSITGGDSIGSVSFTIKTRGGLEGRIKSSWCAEGYRLPEVGLLVKGSKGIMMVNDDMVELRLHGQRSFFWHRISLGDGVSFLLGGPEFFRENEAFVKAALNNCQVEPNFQTALQVDQVIHQVEEKTRGQLPA